MVLHRDGRARGDAEGSGRQGRVGGAEVDDRVAGDIDRPESERARAGAIIHKTIKQKKIQAEITEEEEEDSHEGIKQP